MTAPHGRAPGGSYGAARERYAAAPTPPAALPFGITGIVHTRNEARHIADCLATLDGWTDETLVCDMESTDGTADIARSAGARVLAHPLVANFDEARNLSAAHARFEWIFFLDADERVPPALGPRIRDLARERGGEFAAMTFPFHHYFAGRALRCLEPGYKAPSLLRAGAFRYNARPHEGAAVDGPVAYFPAGDLAIEHFSYDSIEHYIDKLNRYTSAEASNLAADGAVFRWEEMMERFAHDLAAYYDRAQAGEQDGVHGLLWSLLSGFYRLIQHAKLYERRDKSGELVDAERAVPASAADLLRHAVGVCLRLSPEQDARVGQAQAANGRAADAQDERYERVRAQAPATLPPGRATEEGGAGNRGPAAAHTAPADVVWSGPIYDPSGYGEECRNFIFALDGAGAAVTARPVAWSKEVAPLGEAEGRRLAELCRRPVAPDYVQIIQDFPAGFQREAGARACIGRTMFETDRLPRDWVAACNAMDYLWVPSEFNVRTFAQSGVAPEKLRAMPGCFDPAPYVEEREMVERAREAAGEGVFTFLTVFDWTLHKGWDVLLRGFLNAFPEDQDARLVLKVWSTHGYAPQQIEDQACIEMASAGAPREDTRVRFLHHRLTQLELIDLYRAADCFVLPSRGEGWGRPYMEAMACGLPVIGTNWSGNTAFMTPQNSLLLGCSVQPVPERGWAEIPWYRGHRWAEPDVAELATLMRRVYEHPDEARAMGRRAREDVTTRFSRAAVGRIMADELRRLAADVPYAAGAARTQEAVAS